MWYLLKQLFEYALTVIHKACIQLKKGRKEYIYVYVCVSCSFVSDSAIPWTVGCQAPLSMEFSRQEYWRGLTFPSPGEFSRPRDRTLVSSVAGRFFTI